MRRILKALILVLTLSVVLAAFTACDITKEKTTLETPTIASQVYTGSKLVAAVPDNDGYKVESNEGGTNVGEYDVVLTLTDATKYEWATPDSDDATRVTVKFAVTKATNEITSLELESWTYGENAKTPVAKAKFGTPTFSYGTTADGMFTDAVPTAAGKYFVKATVAATANYDGAEKIAEFKIAQAAATVTTAPQPVANLVYTGEELALITEGVGSGGTMQYKTGVDGTWSTELPTATNAGEYTIYYKVLGDDDHSDFVTEEGITVTIAKANAQFTTEPIANANLTYSGSQLNLVVAGVVTNGTLEYKLGDGDWSENIPTAVDVGNYKVFYRVVPTDSDNYNGIEQKELNVSVVKAQNEITTLSIENWTYGESAKAPVATAKFGTAEFGYSDAADGEFSANVPTNAGKYFVKATVKGTNNYDEATKTIPFEIAKATAQTTAPTAKTGLTYNGENQPLVNAGSATGATVNYKIGDGEYSETIPAAINAGEYKVYYKFVANANYVVDEAEVQLTITIAKATAQTTAPTAKTGLTYNGENQPLVNAGSATGATVNYKLGDGEYSETIPAATNAGEYKVYYKFVANANYVIDEAEVQLTITIAKAQNKIDFSVEGITVHCCETVPDLVATATNGEVTFTYSLDGTSYYTREFLDSISFAFEYGKTYYVKASVAESDNYTSAETIQTVIPQHKFEQTVNDGVTTTACACGQKEVTGTLLTKQIVDQNADIVDGTVKAQTGNLDLTTIGYNGNGVVNLSIDEKAYSYIAQNGVVKLSDNLPLSVYGEKLISVSINDGKAVYNVNVNALIVTKTITNAAEYANWINIAKACEESATLWGGYFRLGANITTTSMVTFNRGAIDGSEGFKGVFDGCGYTIDGLNRSSWDSNAFVTTMTNTGVLRNIAFTNVKITGEGNFLTSGGKGTIENVFVQYAVISMGSPYNGTIANQQEGCAMRNVFVDASKAAVSGNGAQFRILTSGTSSGFGGVFGICPSENYTPSQAIGDRGNNYEAIAYFETFAELKANTKTQSVLSAWNDNGFWIVKDGVPMPKNLTVTALNLGAKDIDLDVTVDGDNVSLNDSAVTFDCFAIGFDFTQAVSLTMDGNNVEFAEGDVTVSGGVLSIKRSIFGFAYGEKNIVITDVDGKTITVSATLVTKTLMNATDYANWIKIAKACENANQILGGYFKLGANITSETMVTFDRYDVDGAYGFKGVFDGCGYAIDGLTATGNAFISCMTKDGVLRNIAFTNAKIAGEGNFLCSGGLGTIENVYVQYVSIAAGTDNNGTIYNHCRTGQEGGKITGVFVDASQATLSGTGSKFRLLGGNSTGYNGIFAVCPDGYTLTQARDTGSFADQAVSAFATFDDLKNNSTTQSALAAWSSVYWTIVDGIPTFVTK